MFKKIINKISFYRKPMRYFLNEGVRIHPSVKLIEPKQSMFGSEPFLVKIESNVTVSAGVRFVTHDGGVSIFRGEYTDLDVFGTIQIGKNTFIGLNSIIMPNVRIGENCVIAAGSVVTKDVIDNTVVAGVPSQIIMNTTTYKKKVMNKAHFVRDLSYDDKKNYLNDFFWSSNGKQ